jgi:hypothetical protein
VPSWRRWLESAESLALRTPLAGLMGFVAAFCEDFARNKKELPPAAASGSRGGWALTDSSGQCRIGQEIFTDKNELRLSDKNEFRLSTEHDSSGIFRFSLG